MNQHNFDWKQTNVDMLLYIPNYGRKHLLRKALEKFQFQASIFPVEFKILVVNDGLHEDLSDLEKEYGILWFTFERDGGERNGCMIRNYIIRRSISDTLCTADPEIYFEGHYLQNAWAATQSNYVYRPSQMIGLDPNGNPDKKWIVDDVRLECLHAGLALPTKVLRDMGGYDEHFADFYGYEDVDMLQRLRASGIKFVIDRSVTAFHMHHPRPTIEKTMLESGNLYKKKMRNLQIVANKGREWGEG